MPILEVSGLTVRFPGAKRDILSDVSFTVDAGDFCAIIGPSGAGKSTLIRCVNRLVTPAAGRILLYGEDVAAMPARRLRATRRHVGMIFQEFNLVNRMSVMDNVLSGRLGSVGALAGVFKAFPRADVERALRVLARVGLSDHVDKRADKLSGGQRQRVGIARALMQDPKLLLVDEPTSSLDPKISREVMGLIREIARESQVPVLCNIHDVRLATEFSTKIIGLQDGVKIFDGPVAALDRGTLDRIYAMEVL
jgi:phosphonate transport system ATP-binding protein